MAGLFTDKHVLITGGTSGIGAACARRFLEAGAWVSATFSQNTDLAAQITAELATDRFRTIQSDAATEEGAQFATQQALAWRPIDVLVNNVGGVIRRAPLLDLEAADWHRVVALNLDSTFFFSRAVLPGMRERRSGSIINISALAAKNGGANSGSIPYAVVKAGVETMTVGLARELASTGIRVNAVQSGLVDTPLHRGTLFDAQYGNADEFFERAAGSVPIGRAAAPLEIADCVLFLASDSASYVTGAVLPVTGGL